MEAPAAAPPRRLGLHRADAEGQGPCFSAIAKSESSGPSLGPIPTSGPPTDNARARASPRAHCARSRPRRRRRSRLLTRGRAGRRHANEPTVSAAPRRAGANCDLALVRKRQPPRPRLPAQARFPLSLGGTLPEAKNYPTGVNDNGEQPGKSSRDTAMVRISGCLSFTCSRHYP